MGKARIEKADWYSAATDWFWDVDPSDQDAPCGYRATWEEARDALCANLKAGWR